jgi:hypothetical protein
MVRAFALENLTRSLIRYDGVCFAWLAAVVIAIGGVSSTAGDSVRPSPRGSPQPLLAAHCLEYWGPDDTNSGLRIDTLPASIDSIEAVERWQQVLNSIEFGRCRRTVRSKSIRRRRPTCSTISHR